MAKTVALASPLFLLIPVRPIQIPGYRNLSEVYVGTQSLIYRATSLLDNRPVIIKIPSAEFPSPKEVARIHHEFEVGKLLQASGIVRYLDKVVYERGYALIIEDTGGISLEKYLKLHELNVLAFFKIAIQLAAALGEIHKLGVIHSDIKPGNVTIHAESGQVQIIDLGHASLLSRENSRVITPGLLEGTLDYMSPEQTGRMNRSVDYRTDMYSLGASFYELLSGRLPFESKDNMELVHCHIARNPTSLPTLNADVPEALSKIVMKLMAKTAEARYQTCAGLLSDLGRCADEYEKSGTVSDFIPGQKDLDGRFQIPQKLYGRDNEIALLLQAFERVTDGAAEMMLITGDSGIGKSALVHEVQRPIVRSRGYFISGKFDQFKRDVPYASVIEAFQGLVRQILTEGEDRIHFWKKKLLDALGQSGRIITAVIPEVELIIGPQPPVMELAPAESRNRFNLVFQDFVRAFARREHPLALFLDDLQWADTGSLSLVELLLTDPERGNFFLIGAYRAGEVDSAHPLTLALSDIEQGGAVVTTVHLRPLDSSAMSGLLADLLHCENAKVQSLSDLILRKTGGNPFFSNQFLTRLHEDNLLHFEEARGWVWDVTSIQRMDITENVIDLMAGKILKMPPICQEVLRLAACIGNTFQLNILSIVNETSPMETADQLWPALVEGFIVPLDENYKIVRKAGPELAELVVRAEIQVSYKFLHDRVQQAAYTLIPAQERAALHLKLGRLLLAQKSSESELSGIFDLVGHFNHGLTLIEPHERWSIARMNLLVGKKARQSTAYASAIKYFEAADSLLKEEDWGQNHDLLLDFVIEFAECQFLGGNPERAQALFDRGMERAASPLEKARVLNKRIVLLSYGGRHEEAIRAGVLGLQLLDFDFPFPPDRRAILNELKKVRAGFEENSFEKLLSTGGTADPRILTIMSILVNLNASAYFYDTALSMFNALKLVNASFEYGNSEFSPLGFSVYGSVLCSGGDAKGGYDLADFALKLNEKFGNESIRSKVLGNFAFYVNHWSKGTQSSMEMLDAGFKSCLEAGDILYAGLMLGNAVWFAIQKGDALEAIEERLDRSVEVFKKFKYQDGQLLVTTMRRKILCLRGMTESVVSLSSEDFSEADLAQALTNAGTRFMHDVYRITKAQLYYLFGQPEDALAITFDPDVLLREVSTLFYLAENLFYQSLSLALLISTAGDREEQYRSRLARNEKQFQKWAESCPENFLHQHLLISAEMKRLDGQSEEAMSLYDRAITSATGNGFHQNEAIAMELAGKFHWNQGRRKIAKIYLTDAWWAYRKWGAATKLASLESAYPGIFSSGLSTERRKRESRSSTSTDSVSLDLTSAMKASRAISSEIVLGKLHATMMKIILESAGAERGALLIAEEGRLFVEAESAAGSGGSEIKERIPLELYRGASVGVIHYAARMQEHVVLDDAANRGMFTSDEYVMQQRPKSVLCSPISHRGKITGIIYLENNLTAGAFSRDRLQVLEMLSSQCAIAIENARLYAQLEEKVQARTKELQHSRDETTKLSEFARKLNETKDLDAVLISIFAYIEQTFKVEGILLGLVDSQENALKMYMSARTSGHYTDSQIDFLKQARIPLGEEGGALHSVFVRKRPFYMANTNRSMKNAWDRKIIQELGVKSFLIMPLLIQGQVIGTIMCSGGMKNRLYLSKGDIASIGRFCEQIAGAIHGSFLYQEAKKARERAEAEKENSERMFKRLATIGQMASGIVHDIKNPIGIIKGYAEMAGTSDFGESQKQDFLNIINEEADRLSAMAFEILEFAQGTLSLKPRRFSIKEYMLELHQFLSPDFASHNIQTGLVLNADGDLFFDGDRFRRAIINIANNARDAMQSGGEFSMKVDRLDGMLVFTFEDNGPGIPEHIQSTLFEPFVTHGKAGGTGLGMTMVKDVVEAHGGRIHFETKLGAGTRFVITLPTRESYSDLSSQRL